MAHEELSPLTQVVIGAAIEVHKTLGPGFAEKTYSRAMQLELASRKVPYETERAIRLQYKGKSLGIHRLDLVIDRAVVVELKAVHEINSFHVAQMLSYLKSAELKLGLILNFGRARIQIKRIVLGFLCASVALLSVASVV